MCDLLTDPYVERLRLVAKDEVPAWVTEPSYVKDIQEMLLHNSELQHATCASAVSQEQTLLRLDY